MPTGLGEFRRGDVWLLRLDPTIGFEIQKTRPSVIVSPDEANIRLNTLIVCPLTSTVRNWPTRVQVGFRGRQGEVAADQIRSLDRSRFAKRLGRLSEGEQVAVQDLLTRMFAFV